MAEVKLGQLAQEEESSSEVVKEFAKRMDADKAGEKLWDLASRKNITLPSDRDKKDQLTDCWLSKLWGAEFDRMYTRDMITDHENDVAEFKKEASTGTVGTNPLSTSFIRKVNARVWALHTVCSLLLC